MLKKSLLLASLLLSVLPAWATEYWIDVRVPQQYEQQHIQGAVNIPLSSLQAQISQIVESKTDTIHLYCNTGRQSALAKKQLEKLGYVNVVDEGGIDKLSHP